MSNQRYAGLVRSGTNLTAAEEAEIAMLISHCDELMQRRRVRVLAEIDASAQRMRDMLNAKPGMVRA